MQRAMFATVDEIERVVEAEGIDCDWARGGIVRGRDASAHLRRLRHELAGHRAWGFGDDDYRYLPPDEARAVIGCVAEPRRVFSPHCAAIHPAKLARGLARVVEGLGVDDLRAHAGDRDRTRPGAHAARRRARRRRRARDRGVHRDLPGMRRALAPIYSLMIATEPLPDAFWAEAGLAERPTFTDYRLMIIYGQRTADGRFAFGGRGAPYHLGSRDPARVRARTAACSARCTRRCVRCSRRSATPRSRTVGAARWPCRATGIRRSVSTARRGIAWGGGYVGDGVGTTNLAGRTIADLVLGRDTDLVRFRGSATPHREWEPEPLRWLGVNVGRSSRARSTVPRPRGRRKKVSLVSALLA